MESKSEKVSFHELMKPKLENLLTYLRKVMAEENAPEDVSKTYIAEFQSYISEPAKFEDFVEKLITHFWKLKPEWLHAKIPSQTNASYYHLDFEALEKQKEDILAAIEVARKAPKAAGGITDEQARQAIILLTYEMTPEHKTHFRRYMTMFCEVRHNSNLFL